MTDQRVVITGNVICVNNETGKMEILTGKTGTLLYLSHGRKVAHVLLDGYECNFPTTMIDLCERPDKVVALDG